MWTEKIKMEDGFPLHRVHLRDWEGDKTTVDLDPDGAGGGHVARLNADGLNYLVLTPAQLRRLADWVERKDREMKEWLETEDGKRWIDACG